MRRNGVGWRWVVVEGEQAEFALILVNGLACAIFLRVFS